MKPPNNPNVTESASAPKRRLQRRVVWRRKPCPECGGRMQLEESARGKYWVCSELVENPHNPSGELIACHGSAEYGKPDNDSNPTGGVE